MKGDDSAEILEWRNLPDVYRFTKSGLPISEVGHANWINERLNRIYTEPIYILESDVRLGMFRVDSLEEIDKAYEISILVSPNRLGEGIGSHMLETYFSNCAIDHSVEYFANVHRDNINSLRFFQKHRFQKINQEEQFIRLKRVELHD
jgi:L-amino acid N-acyltransferase YncA